VADFTVASTSVSPQPTDVAIGEFIDYLRVERGQRKTLFSLIREICDASLHFSKLAAIPLHAQLGRTFGRSSPLSSRRS
jgi:hypothetical protein